MADGSGILSAERQPTVIVVAFILAILATVLGVYNTVQVRDAFTASSLVDLVINERVEAATKQSDAKIEALVKRIDELEKSAAAMKAAPPAAPAP